MGKIACKCGTTLRISGEIPNPLEWLIISDQDFDAFTGPIDAEQLYHKVKSMLKCPDCDRLWIFWNGMQEPPACYTQDA
jgi:hypothetical protein